ncbi:13406_t:CDS:2, partial [Racocetra persica]
QHEANAAQKRRSKAKKTTEKCKVLRCELANTRNGVYTFHVQGSFYYRIGSLLPDLGTTPYFLLIYIWDTHHKLQHRTNIISNSNLNVATIQSLKTMLNQ